MLTVEMDSLVRINSLTYVVWDIVSGKIFRSCTCAASKTRSEPYVANNNIRGIHVSYRC